MARKSYSGLDQFKKYRHNRKKGHISSGKIFRRQNIKQKGKGDGGCIFYIIFGIILLALFALIWPVALFALGIGLIVILIRYILKRQKKTKSIPPLSPDEITELKKRLSNIDLCKEIANNSSNEHAVKYAMDELISSIDFIMKYDEEQLRQIGMSKLKLPKQRKFIIENYNVMLEQARERAKEES